MADDRAGSLPAITRRGFLGAVGVSATVLALPAGALAVPPVRPDSAVTQTLIIRRRTDLLRVGITGYGMTVNFGSGSITVDADSPYTTLAGTRAGRLAVDFGPQHVLEEAFSLTSNPNPQPPARSRLAGASRVVFTIPSDLTLSLSSILAWSQYLTAAPPVAIYPPDVAIPPAVVGKGYAPPREFETSIEIPWYLIISPHAFSAWSQMVNPKTVDGRTELFNSWMGIPVAGSQPNADTPNATVRGVWVRGAVKSSDISDGMANPAPGAEGNPFESIPTQKDRVDIVRLTTRTGNNEPGGPAAPVRARLTLTPLGGHLDANGQWDQPQISSMMSWQQRIWQGRDTYAKVVRRGYLYPWGLRAALIEQGIRVWKASARAGGDIRPYWFKTFQVAVTEPTLEYADIPLVTVNGRRGALFQSVTCLTGVTPLLAPSQAPLNADGWAGKAVYVPKVAVPGGTTPFSFPFMGVDANGNEVSFTMPLLFAEDDPDVGAGRANFTERGAEALRRYYGGLPEEQRLATLGGVGVGFASGAQPLDTSLPVTGLIFDIAEAYPGSNVRLISANSGALESAGQPRNVPLLKEARTIVENLSRIAGQPVIASMNFPLPYVQHGLDLAQNKGLVFLQNAAATATRFGMDAAKSGGVVVPSMDLAGFSSALGPVYGTAQSIADLATGGTITPGDALQAIKLLGGVSLADILPVTFPALNGTGPSDKALRVSSEVVDGGQATERVVTTMAMSWRASELIPSGIAEELLDVSRATLNLRLVVEVPTGSGNATWTVLGSFDDFTVSLVPVDGLQFVAIDVDTLKFTSGSGNSSDVDVDVRDVRFGGALAFVALLAEYLPFGDGLSVDISASGIKAGMTLGLPSIGLGAFTLSGIFVSTGLTLPFGSSPVRFRFGLSSTDDPFGVTVMGIGGGGWTTFDLGLDGIEYFDVAAFVQAKVALDFGVASGSVSVQYGMQYALGSSQPGDPEECTLTAFVRIQGRVDVLGIVTVAIEVYLGLGIDLPLAIPANPAEALAITVHGEARCSISISLAFFSKTVSFTVKRSFQGSDLPGADYVVKSVGSGPVTPVTFAQAVSEQDWNRYCGAFA